MFQVLKKQKVAEELDSFDFISNCSALAHILKQVIRVCSQTQSLHTALVSKQWCVKEYIYRDLN